MTEDQKLAMLAEQLRINLEAVNSCYQRCLDNGLAGYWYIGPNSVHTELPDKVILKTHKVTTY
jgi:hypothetical protein